MEKIKLDCYCHGPWFLINYRLIALQATKKLFEGTIDINIYIHTKFSHILAEDHHGKLKY